MRREGYDVIAVLAQNRAARSAGAKMGNKVLLVDDEKDFLEIFSAWLSFKGYEVSTALNGEEALEKLKEGDFDLVLLDLMMPLVDGYEFLRRVRRSGEYGSMPVVILTAVQRLSGYAKAHRAGADAYLEKLASHDEIAETIEKVMRARAGADHGENTLH